MYDAKSNMGFTICYVDDIIIYYCSLFRDGDNNIQEEGVAAAMSAVQE